MKKQHRITSKYLIEKSHFFSRSQLVLSLQENYLHMQPLSSDREEKDGGVTRIDWDSILSVQASERNPKEFTISALPNGKKKSQLISNKNNAVQHVFTCRERNRLITEIMHKLHLHDGDQTYLKEIVQYQSDIYRDNSKKVIAIKLFPTVMQMVVIPKDPKK